MKMKVNLETRRVH